MNAFEIKIHNNHLISIKDNKNDISLADPKWNFIFEYIQTLSNYSYFYGNRLEYDLLDKDKSFIKSYSDSNSHIDKDFFNVFVKINNWLLWSERSGISRLWSFYEYPSFQFILDENYESSLKLLCLKNQPVEIILRNIPNYSIIYKSFETNVLWWKSNDNISSFFKDKM